MRSSNFIVLAIVAVLSIFTGGCGLFMPAIMQQTGETNALFRAESREDQRLALDLEIEADLHKERMELRADYRHCMDTSDGDVAWCEPLLRAYNLVAGNRGGVDPAWKAGYMINSAMGAHKDWQHEQVMRILAEKARDSEWENEQRKGETLRNAVDIAEVDRTSQKGDRAIVSAHDDDLLLLQGSGVDAKISNLQLRREQEELRRQIEELEKSAPAEKE